MNGGEVDLSTLINYGFAGLLLLAIFAKQIVPGWIYTALKKQNEDLNAQVKRLQDVHEEKVLPALYKYNEVLGKLVHEDIRLPPNGG